MKSVHVWSRLGSHLYSWCIYICESSLLESSNVLSGV
ncbi:hypothetical protein AB205_0175310 [Aquarana catesbeiana]|uniref:Uncharacterized protein n=1 Tax=Aquarana catesbeiana TaxID=8400 RepID=A0A2G9R8Q7_AQUCT|nr:hypothetical protein AB205_0175310 [Aquarana catesbeiana]